MRMTSMIVSFGALLVSGALLVFLGGQDPQVFGAAGGTDIVEMDLIRYGVAFVAMIAGVILGSAFRALQAMRENGVTEIRSYAALANNIVRSIDFATSIVAAPLIYILLLKTVDGIGTWGLAIVALENGFFCNAVIQKLVAGKQTS